MTNSGGSTGLPAASKHKRRVGRHNMNEHKLGRLDPPQAGTQFELVYQPGTVLVNQVILNHTPDDRIGEDLPFEVIDHQAAAGGQVISGILDLRDRVSTVDIHKGISSRFQQLSQPAVIDGIVQYIPVLGFHPKLPGISIQIIQVKR